MFVCHGLTGELAVINFDNHVLVIVIFCLLLFLLLKFLGLSGDILDLKIVVVQRVNKLEDVRLVFVKHFFLN